MTRRVPVTTRILSTFDDPALDAATWSRLLAAGGTDALSLTWHSQRLWWQEKARGRLCMVVAERDRVPVAVAPLYHNGRLATNLHPNSWLDLVGDVRDPEVLDALLVSALAAVPGCKGIYLNFIPHVSPTAELLQAAAARLGLHCSVDQQWPSPCIDLRASPERSAALARKKTVLRRENQLRRLGELSVSHFRTAEQVLPQMDTFFAQHVSRWADTPTPSRYRDPQRRSVYLEATRVLADSGWLRFSRLDLNGEPIAFHRGTCYRGHFKYSRTTYAVEFADLSPGAVLLRHLLLAAIEEGIRLFDFGLGDEAYKYRYATDEVLLQSWFLQAA